MNKNQGLALAGLFSAIACLACVPDDLSSFKLNFRKPKMVYAQPDEPNSIKDDDPKVAAMIDWVVANGGVCNAETRINKTTGARGLYSTRDFTEMTEPIVRIPNKLIVSSYHIKR
jgi:hypothetical protein